jgi:hypothetical protein
MTDKTAKYKTEIQQVSHFLFNIALPQAWAMLRRPPLQAPQAH